MSVFKNPFLSISGQIERFQNVGNVLSQSLNPFSNSKPVANTGNTYANAALNIAVSHPYATAGVVTAGVTGLATSALSSLSTTTKIVGSAIASVAVPAVLVSPKATTAVANVISNTQPLRLGSSIGNAIENPNSSNLKSIVSDNKTTLAVGGIAAAVVAGIAATGLIANYSNTQAVQENTKATIRDKENKIVVDTSGETNYTSAEIKELINQRLKEVNTPVAAVSTPVATPITKTTTKKKSKKKKTTKLKKKYKKRK
jgi:hypothetical protein